MRPIVTISQDTDTPARREVTSVATLTYLYDRSHDSRESNTSGQDFIAFATDETGIAFAVCDGVSQSFYGDLAARFLGERLVGWMAAHVQDGFDRERFEAQIDANLRAWTAEATALVDAKVLNPDLPPMVRDALERKRPIGSETMFVAGAVILHDNLLAVTWMGDMRLWVSGPDGEMHDLPGAVWETRERWSSRVGPKNGAPHTAILPLDGIAGITIHSDGIGDKTAELHDISPDKLDALARELAVSPGSDDISVLDIALQPAGDVERLAVPQLTLPDPRVPVIQWTAVPGAGWYRVETVSVESDTDRRVREVTGTTFTVSPGGALGVTCRVQALASAYLPSEWSAALTVTFPAPVSAGHAPALEAFSVRPADARKVPEAPGGFEGKLILVLSLLLALGLSIWWYLSNILNAVAR